MACYVRTPIHEWMIWAIIVILITERAIKELLNAYFSLEIGPSKHKLEALKGNYLCIKTTNLFELSQNYNLTS